MHTRKEQMEAFGRFLDILDELREKCPWDRKQTNESLRPNTIEETYELCDALMKDDKKDICKELGDVLLHVAFYAKIGSETGDFDIKDVCDRLCEKLIFRHPHVFGEVKADTAEKVTENWEQLKMKEKDGNKMVLSGVPSALPSLIKAYRIQDKARNVGFDWEERSQVWSKVKEEIGEFEAEYAGKMQMYLTALDEQIKLPDENPSIGIIICKSKDKTFVEYALKQTNAPIGVATYQLRNTVPEDMKAMLPDPDEIAKRLKIFEEK